MTRRLADALPGLPRGRSSPAPATCSPSNGPRELVDCLTTFIGEDAHV